MVSQLWAPRARTALITALYLCHFCWNWAASPPCHKVLHTIWQDGAPYLIHWQQINSSAQNTEKGRRYVSTHCACDKYVYYVAVFYIQSLGNGVQPSMCWHSLLSTREPRMLLGINEGLNPPYAHQHCFWQWHAIQACPEGWGRLCFLYQHSTLFSFKKATGSVIYFRL